MKHTIEIKRAYDVPLPDDGFRVYADRLWPRGMSHETFHYDLWDKEIAPSTKLREWFHSSPGTLWEDFARRYKSELEGSLALSSLLEAIADKPKVTLLYSSRDRLHNNAVVLEDVIKEHES